MKKYSNEQVKKIISLHFPDLKVTEIKLLGEGGNNYAYEINNEYVFRFPKSLKSEQDCQKEINLLKALKPYLNLLTPDFEFIGNAQKFREDFQHRNFISQLKNLLSHILNFLESKLNLFHIDINFDKLRIDLNCYDKLFVGYKKIKGVVLDEEIFATFSLEERDCFAKKIAELFLAIHNLVIENSEMKIPVWNFNKEYYFDMYRKIGRYILPEISESQGQILLSFYRSYMNDPKYYEYTPCLIHADLCWEHILFDQLNHRIGVIDFGGACLGDPDYDFFGIYNDYGIEFLRLVFQHYGREITDELLVKFQAFLCGSIAVTIELSQTTNNTEILDYVEPSLKKLLTNITLSQSDSS